jgi:hypothetical protein
VAEIAEADLKGLRLIKSFNKTLRQVCRRRQGDLPVRQREYLSLYLYGLLNPVVRSMRALCQISRRESAQPFMGSGAFSRSTFSEMQHLVEPALLEEVFQELAREVQNQQPVGPGQVPWRIVDSSVFNVLPRLGWAYFKEHNAKPQSAIRLHVSVDLLSNVPVAAKITTAKVGERQVWGHLGKSDKTRSPRVRVLWIAMANGEQLMLVTNQGPEQMPADLVSLTYRNRWQVELFFRWLKCILRCRHFLAESPRGVAIQLYLALIGAVLLQLHLGRRPSLRLWEALQFYFLGIFTQKDLAAAIAQEKALIGTRAAKKS